MNFNFIVMVVFVASCKIFVHAVHEYLKGYEDAIYKIHPLVLITTKEMNRERVELLPQDQLDDNESLKNINLNQNQNMVMYCSGYLTCLAMEKKDEMNINYLPSKECKRAEISKTVFEKSKIYQAHCLSPVLGTISLPVPPNRCANGRGVLVHAGFRFQIFNPTEIFKFDPSTHDLFLPLYDICYDKITSSPIYTKHQLVKSKLLYKEVILSEMPMRRNSKNLMVSKYDRAAYKPKQLKYTFENTFGLKTAKSLLDMFEAHNGQALLPYRLTPAGDYFYQSVKSATFMAENSVPVFSTIYDGNLKTVELIGRILAVQLNKTLDSVSGSFDLWKLKNDKKIEKILYIDREPYGKNNVKTYRPVMKYIYKIYYDPVLKSGIAFVTFNDPYKRIAPPCDNIMDQFMEYNLFSNALTAGITVCCNIINLIQRQPVLNYLLNDFEFGPGILRLDFYNESFPTNIFNPSGKRSKYPVREKSKFLEKFDSLKIGKSG